jgi:hypothetical protein
MCYYNKQKEYTCSEVVMELARKINVRDSLDVVEQRRPVGYERVDGLNKEIKSMKKRRSIH